MRLLGLILASIALGAPQAVPVSGWVSDESGAPLANAKLTLTPGEFKTSSGMDGRFVFEAVPVGAYALRVEAKSMGALDQKIAVRAGAAEWKLQLKPSAKKDEVTVTATKSAVEEESIGAERNADRLNFDEELLAALPAPAQNSLAAAAAFVSPAAQGAEGLNITVDGMESSASSLTAQSIRRIRINRNPYSLQFRRPGKARIEVYTEEPSTRRYKGTFGFAARDSVFDARNAFAPARPPLRRTLADLSLGGPWVAKRTTFFVNGEHYRNDENAVVNAVTLEGPFLRNVPTPERRTRFLGRIEDRGETHTRLLLFSYWDEEERNRGVGGLKLPSQGFTSSTTSHRTQFSDRGLLGGKVLNDFRLVLTRESATGGAAANEPAILVHGAFTGGPAQTRRHRQEASVRVQDIGNYSFGRHTLRFGGEFRPAIFRSFEGSNFGGTYEFASLESYARNQPFLFRINQGNPDIRFSQHEAFGFVQDEWKAAASLLLTYGVRYSWQSDVAGRNNVAPRAGFAWALGGKTVLRGGAGVFHERVTEDVQRRSLLWNGTRLRELVTGESANASNTIWQRTGLSLPRLIQASVAIEQELWKRTTLTAEYQHLRGANLLRALNLTVAPFTHQVESNSILRGDSLAFTLRGAWKKRLSGMAQYTLSRTNDNTGGPFNFPADSHNLAAEWGRSAYDSRHRIQAVASFEIPGGYRTGLIFSAGSGAPYDITTGRDNNGDAQVTDRPAGVTRNTGQGPGYFTVDLRFTKLLRLPRLLERGRTSRNVELSLDAFNLLNRVNFASYVGVVTSPFFGRANQALSPRAIQLSIRYRF
jgi:hypothetical protein